MPDNFTVRLRHELLAAWKWCLSFRKRDWTLEDYPIVIRLQRASQDDSVAERCRVPPFSAQVVNWWTLSGVGQTKQEALQELQKYFDLRRDTLQREGRRLFRPGTRAPIEFAFSARIESYGALANDFIERVLGLPWAFISDESSLWDLDSEATSESLQAKIRDVYGVDVSDIASGNIADILDRIARERDGVRQN